MFHVPVAEAKILIQLMDEGLPYLQRIHEALARVAGVDFSLEPVELCRRVLGDLGLPETAANPLVAKSFEANLAVRDQQDLLNS